jgi:hypothetical protein
MSFLKSIGRTAKRIGVGLVASSLPGGALATKALGDITGIFSGKNSIKSVTVADGGHGGFAFDMATGADAIRAGNARNLVLIGAALMGGAWLLLKK